MWVISAFQARFRVRPYKCGKRDLSDTYLNYPVYGVIRFSEGTIQVPPLGSDGAKTRRQLHTTGALFVNNIGNMLMVHDGHSAGSTWSTPIS